MTTRTDAHMTRMRNARVAGFTFLFYIVVVLTEMVLFDGATSGEGITAKLAGIAQQVSNMRISVLLNLLTCFAALVLAVTLYAITRDEDNDLAVLALACRVGEGILNAILPLATLGLLWFATAGTPNDAAATETLVAFLLEMRAWSTTIGATFFTVGSTLFCWLLLRGRTIPVALAWLGLLASVPLVVGLPAQLTGFLGGPVTSLMWLPMLVFELVFGLWLLIKGVNAEQWKKRAPASPSQLSP